MATEEEIKKFFGRQIPENKGYFFRRGIKCFKNGKEYFAISYITNGEFAGMIGISDAQKAADSTLRTFVMLELVQFRQP